MGQLTELKLNEVDFQHCLFKPGREVDWAKLR